MISPEGFRYYRRIATLAAVILTSLLFFFASRYFPVGALLVGMLIPLAFALLYALVWRLVLPKGAYGHVVGRPDSGQVK